MEQALRDENGAWLPDSERQLVEAGMADTVPASTAMMTIVERVRAVMSEEDEAKPMRDDKDLSKDMVYRLGMRAGLNMLRAIPVAARSIMNEQRKGS